MRAFAAGLLVLMIMLAGGFVSAQSLNGVTECTTPSGSYGSCILLDSCQSLMRLLISSGSNSLDVLRKSQCGFVGTEPKVCCPNNEHPIHFRDPETTTANQKQSRDPSTTTPTTSKRPPVSHTTTTSILESHVPSQSQLYPAQQSTNSVVQFIPPSNAATQEAGALRPADDERISDGGSQNVDQSTNIDLGSRRPVASEFVPLQPLPPPGLNKGMSPQQNASLRGNVLPGTNSCGTITITNKIYGGENTSIDDFPWMALLKYRTDAGEHYGCGGVLINHRYVLTAAHCVRTGKGFNLTQVRLGEWNLETKVDCTTTSECNAPPLDMSIEDVVVHPEFNIQNLTNDIALVRLSQTVSYSDWVQPICLPDNMDRDYTDQSFWVAGWGQTNNGMTSPLKLKLEVHHVPVETCAVAYRLLHIALGPSTLCAGGRLGKDTCAGDSGGPLMKLLNLDSSSNFYAVGVVSLGPSRCGLEGWAGVYTKVSHYVEWIRSSLRP